MYTERLRCLILSSISCIFLTCTLLNLVFSFANSLFIFMVDFYLILHTCSLLYHIHPHKDIVYFSALTFFKNNFSFIEKLFLFCHLFCFCFPFGNVLILYFLDLMLGTPFFNHSKQITWWGILKKHLDQIFSESNRNSFQNDQENLCQ